MTQHALPDPDQMRAAFLAGIAAADPARAVTRALDRGQFTRPEGRIFVLAIGKAAGAMMGAALAALPKPHAALVVTNYENASPVPGRARHGGRPPGAG